jgi:hypothetical protein
MGKDLGVNKLTSQTENDRNYLTKIQQLEKDNALLKKVTYKSLLLETK